MDFNQVINRYHFSSAKWGHAEEEDRIPLTVADMDFMTSPAIMEGVRRISEHGIFGYTGGSDLFSHAIKEWYKHQHHVEVNEKWIAFCPRILTGVNFMLNLLCKEGESVVVFSPWYVHLAHGVTQNNLKLIEHKLVLREQGYEIDFAMLEEQIIHEEVKAIVLTNPHNPTGRVWRKEELLQLVDLCSTYGCYLISDDIHSDIVYGDHGYYPLLHFPDIHQQLILFNSPAKTFNVAGLHTSYAIIPDEKIRQRFQAVLRKYMINQPNNYAVDITYEAYMHSHEWYQNLMAYLEGNLNFLYAYLDKNLPFLEPIPSEGTYLAWLSYEALAIGEEEFKERMLACGVQLNLGSDFGDDYTGYVRLNYACPRSILTEALNRLTKLGGRG